MDPVLSSMRDGPLDAVRLNEILDSTGLLVAEVVSRPTGIDVALADSAAEAGFEWPPRSADAHQFWDAVSHQINVPGPPRRTFRLLLSGRLIVVQLDVMSDDRWAVLWWRPAVGGHQVASDHEQLVRDELTGLYNRRALFDIADFDDPATSPFASVLLTDVRRFKSINDVWGQAGGDRCLVEVSRWLQSIAGPTDVIVRLAGDEFLLLCEAGSTVAAAVEQAGELDFDFGGERIPVTLQAGWTPRLAGQPLLQAADNAERALAVAKRSVLRTVVEWTPEISRTAQERVAEEETVRTAIAGGDVNVHFQPLIDVATSEVFGMESLVRLRGPGSGISAERIVDASHQLGLMSTLAKTCFQQAFRDGLRLRSKFASLMVGVNISREFMGTGLAIDSVIEAAAAAGLPCSNIVVELTEEVAVGVSAADLVAELRYAADLGLTVVIDDFGRGETALSLLRMLPLGGIKLDKSLIPAGGDDAGWSFVEGTVSLLRTLAPRLVAEGVETELQSRRLHDIGVSIQQGFLFGRPELVGHWLQTDPAIPGRRPT
jgi:diguanylate cyclase (GGDEF)-like protein